MPSLLLLGREAPHGWESTFRAPGHEPFLLATGPATDQGRTNQNACTRCDELRLITWFRLCPQNQTRTPGHFTDVSQNVWGCCVSVLLKWFLLLAREKSPDFLTRRPLYIKTHEFSFISAAVTTANDNDRGHIKRGGKGKRESEVKVA